MSYEKNKYNLVYLANIRLLTEKAHGLQIMKMCEAFASNGTDVELLVPSRKSDIIDDPFKYYNVKKIFRIKKVPCFDIVFFELWGVGFLVQTVSFLFVAWTILALRRREFFLYTREPLSGVFFRNFYLELHDMPEKIKKINVWLWSRSKKIVVLTSFLKRELEQVGVGREVLIAPDGVSLEDFSLTGSRDDWRRVVGLPLDKKIIIYTGSFHLYDWKGVDILLEATKKISLDSVCVLVGGAKDEIEDLRIRWPQKNIIFREKVRHKLVPYYLKSADVLVLPNKRGNVTSEKYTSPLKLFEYMASGVPIVASELPSIKEVLNESNSILVEPNDPEDLAQSVEKILKNNNLAQEKSNKSLSDVQEYTWMRRSSDILNFISKI